MTEATRTLPAAAPLHVRDYRPADRDALISLWHACELTRSWNDPARDIERRRAIEDGLFLVGVHRPGNGGRSGAALPTKADAEADTEADIEADTKADTKVDVEADTTADLTADADTVTEAGAEAGPGAVTGAGHIVASAMGGYDGHRGWVYYVAVHPDHRGAGHGRVLMAELEARLLTSGCPKLNLQVRGGNADALAFYARLGFAVDDVVGLGKRLIPDE